MRKLTAVLAFALSTTGAALAQSSCDGGPCLTPPGRGPVTPAPEIHASSTVGGAGLLLCTAIMLLPRKKRIS